MQSAGTEYIGMYITIGYTMASMLLGGIVAARKQDFATRGVAVSMFAGLFGPLFMVLDRSSRARKDSDEIWPARGPEAVILNVVLVSAFNYLV
jgi:hypothetical protein